MHWAEISAKTTIIVDKNRKPKTKLEKTCKPLLRDQNRKTAGFKCKKRKIIQKIGQICKTKNPNAPF